MYFEKYRTLGYIFVGEYQILDNYYKSIHKLFVLNLMYHWCNLFGGIFTRDRTNQGRFVFV